MQATNSCPHCHEVRGVQVSPTWSPSPIPRDLDRHHCSGENHEVAMVCVVDCHDGEGKPALIRCLKICSVLNHCKTKGIDHNH
jgi:hypothetical protein